MEEEWNAVAVYNTIILVLLKQFTVMVNKQQSSHSSSVQPVLQFCSAAGWGGSKVEGLPLWPWKSANCAIETLTNSPIQK